MPTTRRRRGHHHTPADDALQRTHLALGDCLLAGPAPFGCFCGLRLADGTEDARAIAAARTRLGIAEDA